MIYEPISIDTHSCDEEYYEFLLLTCGRYLFEFELSDKHYSDDILDIIEYNELTHYLVNLFCNEKRLIDAQIGLFNWYEAFWPQYILPEVQAIRKLAQL